MSSISSTGPDYSYYQQQVSDLEDQNAKERKKAQERDDEHVSSLERKYNQRLRSQEEDGDRAITRAKESADSALSSERESNKAEMERLKRDTYDRYGRVSRGEGAEHRQRLDELQGALDRREQENRDNLRETQDAYGKEQARQGRAAQENMRRTLEDTRSKLGEQNENARDAARRDYRDLAGESSKRYNDLNRQHLEEMSAERKLANEALEGARDDYSRRLDVAKQAYDKNTSRQEEALRDSLTEGANKLRASHFRETQHLREKMGDLIEGEKQYVKSGAQGRSDAVNEYENDWRRRVDAQGGSYQRQISDLKAQNDRTESSLSHQNYENMRSREDFLAHTLKAQTQKHHQEMKNMENALTKDIGEVEAARKHDGEIRDKQFEQRMAKVSSENQEAMGLQAKALQESTERQRQSDREELTQAEASLHEQRTSPDTAIVSPAAEASMRRQIASQYEKTAQADQLRNHRETDRLRDDYKQRFTDMADSERSKDSKISRQIASERDEDRAQFTTHVADLEYAKDSALSEQQKDQAREADKLTKNYTRLISHQNSEHERQLDDVRGSALSKLDALREESSFDRKMSMREFNNKQNQLIHDYQKKLSDQKTEYEDRLSEQKLASDTAAHENERRYRNTLDQQGRAYEHKLAQQDAQFKERERFLSETYQDEIDKLKRSNQLLIQKRS